MLRRFSRFTMVISSVSLMSLLCISEYSKAVTQTQQAEALIQAFVGLHLASAQIELMSVLTQLRELMLEKQKGTITTVSFILKLSELGKKLDEIKERYRLIELSEALAKISLKQKAESIFVPSKQRMAIRWTLHTHKKAFIEAVASSSDKSHVKPSPVGVGEHCLLDEKVTKFSVKT